MRKKMDIILSAEESFARAVILGLIVKRPLSVWHFLIPGIFIFQHLRRSSEIRKYTSNSLFPKIQALEAALEINMGKERQKRFLQIEESVKVWLTSLKLYSERLHQRQMEEIKLHIDHYSRLLNAKGKNYYLLVKDAYKIRRDYKAYLQQLALAEEKVDQAIIETLGEGIKEQLLKEKAQIEELREKQIDKIFPDDSC